MFHILSFTKENIVALKATGKVNAEDYHKIQPLLQKTVKDFGSIDLYLEIEDIGGIEPMALWEDFKTYFNYVGKIHKIAIVGEDNWSKALAAVIKPMIMGEVKFYMADNSLEAKRWIDQ
jgi:hypothetical protein